MLAQDDRFGADAVTCLSDDADVAARFEGRAQTRAGERVIFDEHDANAFAHAVVAAGRCSVKMLPFGAFGA